MAGAAGATAKLGTRGSCTAIGRRQFRHSTREASFARKNVDLDFTLLQASQEGRGGGRGRTGPQETQAAGGAGAAA